MPDQLVEGVNYLTKRAQQEDRIAELEEENRRLQAQVVSAEPITTTLSGHTPGLPVTSDASVNVCGYPRAKDNQPCQQPTPIGKFCAAHEKMAEAAA